MLDGLVKPLQCQILDKQPCQTIRAIKLHSHKITRCVEGRHAFAAEKGSEAAKKFSRSQLLNVFVGCVDDRQSCATGALLQNEREAFIVAVLDLV